MLKRFFKNRIVKVVLWLHVVALVSIVMLYFYLKKTTRDTYHDAITDAPYDVIIVPGYPYKGKWHDIMKTRIYWSKYLWEKGLAKHIIYSGSAVYSPYIEGTIMKQYAIELGVPENLIFTETNAEHSTENLFYSYELAKSKGFKKIALATDPFQSFFLQQYAESRPFKIKYLPIQYTILEQLHFLDVIIDPEIALKEDFKALPERESFWQRLRGTMGENIEDQYRD
ncbi:YdcF family protein [Fulvivirga sp. 29W222]|uniref:YdcF family protein n=1 Tax=Fulvivirga marina TaxID=2494733 RepID=A0A937G103_9BACT|nr:YdcF family protein [Fulvivirga marina]MBL6446516.1 YdcF family protein [Fulvivirga marina]